MARVTGVRVGLQMLGDLNNTRFQYGIAWLWKQQAQLIKEYATALAGLSGTLYDKSHKDRLEAMAAQDVGLFLQRLATNRLDTNLLRQIVIERRGEGARLPELIAGADCLKETFTRLIYDEMIDQLEIARELDQRAQYITSLIKVTLAAAIVSYDALLPAPQLHHTNYLG